jgi:hypothetical protein
MTECLSCQNRCPDCTTCFTRLHQERDAARSLAHALLSVIESYLRFDYSAPRRVRETAVAARKVIAEWNS